MRLLPPLGVPTSRSRKLLERMLRFLISITSVACIVCGHAQELVLPEGVPRDEWNQIEKLIQEQYPEAITSVRLYPTPEGGCARPRSVEARPAPQTVDELLERVRQGMQRFECGLVVTTSRGSGHRRFLRIHGQAGQWRIENLGTRTFD